MKKLLSSIIIICMLPFLSGCGSIYSNYREVEQILAVQTMGLDKLDNGIRLSLAAPSTTRTEGSPVCLTGDGQSITLAIERIRNYSSEEDLFCAHVNHVVLGEDAARQGIESILAYICRSSELRIDTPLYVVREHSAEELISGVVTGGTGICEVLDAVKSNADERGDSYVFTAAQVVRKLDRHGSALICALEYSDSDERTEGSENPAPADGSSTQDHGGASSQEQEDRPAQKENSEQPAPEAPAGQAQGKTAAVAGYGILKGDRLCGYIGREEAIGANFLMNLVGVSDILVEDRDCAYVILEITQGGTQIVPVWDEEDSLKGIDVYAHVRASIHEVQTAENHSGGEYEDYITAQLEAAISRTMSAVLQTSKRLQADFLGLEERIEMADPLRFRNQSLSFEELLPKLEIRISVSGKLSHTNNLKDT